MPLRVDICQTPSSEFSILLCICIICVSHSYMYLRQREGENLCFFCLLSTARRREFGTNLQWRCDIKLPGKTGIKGGLVTVWAWGLYVCVTVCVCEGKCVYVCVCVRVHVCVRVWNVCNNSCMYTGMPSVTTPVLYVNNNFYVDNNFLCTW